MTTREDIPIEQNSKWNSLYPNGKTYLFFIAIDCYTNGINSLSNAVRDAETVADCLINNYELDRRNLKMLFDKEATAETILKTFEEYHELLTSEDNLLFYFSGHGYYDEKNKNGYWLTVDSQSNKKNTYLANNEVISFIKNLKARHVFGIVDSCFSEALFKERNVKTLVKRRYNFPSRWLLTSGRLEVVSDGFPGEHSPFAKTLLTFLNHQSNKHLWVSELCSNVINRISYNTEKQLPRGEPLSNVGNQGGEFLFLRKGQTLESNLDTIENSDKDQIINVKENLEIKITNSNPSKTTNLNTLKNELEEQLTDNEWKLVFNQLKQVIKNSKKKQLLRQLIRRFNSINNIKISGAESSEHITIGLNRIHSDLNTFIGDLEERDLNLLE